MGYRSLAVVLAFFSCDIFALFVISGYLDNMKGFFSFDD